MRNRIEIISVLNDIDKEINQAKKLSVIKNPTRLNDIELAFHLSQIEYHSKNIKEILNKNTIK